MDNPIGSQSAVNGHASLNGNGSDNGSNHHKPSLLLVEDNPETLILVKRMLRDLYEVTGISDADEAERAIVTKNYDGILMDINLGADKSGIDLLGEARETNFNQSTPIVALTAYALPGDAERFLNYGFDAYLGKPFTKKQLLSRIEEMLANGR